MPHNFFPKEYKTVQVSHERCLGTVRRNLTCFYGLRLASQGECQPSMCCANESLRAFRGWCLWPAPPLSALFPGLSPMFLVHSYFVSNNSALSVHWVSSCVICPCHCLLGYSLTWSMSFLAGRRVSSLCLAPGLDDGANHLGLRLPHQFLVPFELAVS